MSDPILSAYTAMEARMKIVDVIANNLANTDTIGFKRDLGRLLEGDNGFEVGTYMDLGPGDFRPTGNALDVAIDGDGFFSIDTPNGVRYTRNGSFAISKDGQLETKDGMALLSTRGTPINVGPGVTSVEVREGGSVTVDGREIASLSIVRFKNSSLMEKEGMFRTNWKGPASDIQKVNSPRILAGHLEKSNVNPVNEMVHLMSAYREFEAVQRTLKTLTSDMNAKLVQELGKLGG